MRKKVLIIGANSAFAKDVAPILAGQHEVITAGKTGCDVYCDIPGTVTIPDGVDVVINFAASFGGTSDEDISDALRTNVQGTLEICKASKKAGVAHIISISSIFTLLDETSPSYSIYALTKKHADELATFYCRLNRLPLTILRPSRIYGDSDRFEKNQPFLYHLIRKAESGDDIAIFGKHDPERNYIHTADLAEVIMKVIDQRVEGAYATTYPTNVTYSQIAKAAQKIFGRGGKVSFLDDKPDIPNDEFPLDQSLYQNTDFQPQISIEAGIERIKQFREGSA